MCSHCNGGNYDETEQSAMRIECAWCKATMREADPGHESDPVSHGICEPCLAKTRAEAKSVQANVDVLMGALIGNGDVRL